ncbi:SDR family oxidoreductase [Aureimonas phyllosphaerae]|uniref:Short-subunit dehydrogenase n=1 Tax=Aureimonas phyllosphaerae TaxID=1166078 RepID=A0A7W6FUD4_9HYPH|nr:SDR family oxidoreductase [Aureimonas phyllosphaerae]MBB3936104.1 short-subunit dehydrogenase [Aureimonas phyllosphaerae]MBB3960171.1 short-subunit dehydrogenase [Aureimonas phyllosphaerae]SFF33989.1 Short-chain dehydrogenase [Aureimonas phyllosphaerae]
MAGHRRTLSGMVVVLTGASSGIGRATALEAARRGARLTLVARGQGQLEAVRAEVEALGAEAIALPVDVSSDEALRSAAEAVVARFGRFDAWVNNAGVAAYATLTDLPLADHRRLFETNYWGTVHGSLAAVAHFRSRPGRGRLVNVGSVNGDVPVPLLSAYSASKHAVKGFTDALRMELLAAGDRIDVVQIKPSGIASALPHHARNHLAAEPRVMPPLYAPELVATSICDALERPVREVTIGLPGGLLRLGMAVAPSLTDRVIAAVVPPITHSRHPLTPTDNLDRPTEGGRIHSPYTRGIPISPYTALQLHRAALKIAGLSLGALWLLARRRRR